MVDFEGFQYFLPAFLCSCFLDNKITKNILEQTINFCEVFIQ